MVWSATYQWDGRRRDGRPTLDRDREGEREVVKVAVILLELDETPVELFVERAQVVEVRLPSEPLVHCITERMLVQ